MGGGLTVTVLREEGIIMACAEAGECAVLSPGVCGTGSIVIVVVAARTTSFCKGTLSVEPYERGKGVFTREVFVVESKESIIAARERKKRVEEMR